MVKNATAVHNVIQTNALDYVRIVNAGHNLTNMTQPFLKAVRTKLEPPLAVRRPNVHHAHVSSPCVVR